MKTRGKKGLAMSFVLTIAGLPACGRPETITHNPPPQTTNPLPENPPTPEPEKSRIEKRADGTCVEIMPDPCKRFPPDQPSPPCNPPEPVPVKCP